MNRIKTLQANPNVRRRIALAILCVFALLLLFNTPAGRVALNLDDPRDPLTWRFCLAMFIVFLAVAGWLFDSYFGFRADARSALASLETADPAFHGDLLHAWQAYRATFLTDADGRFSTETRASAHFTADSAGPLILRGGFLALFPGTFVGLGILGTFLGLAASLGNIRVDRGPEEIIGSIQGLIPCIKTAFYTSIWGMTLSLLASIADRCFVGGIDARLAALAKKLDDKYFNLEIVRKARRRESVRLVAEGICQALGFEEPDPENPKKILNVPPGETLRRIRDDIAEGARIMKNFRTDLADEAQVLRETLERLNTLVHQAIRELAERVNTGVEVVRKTQSEHADAILEHLVGELKSFVGDIGTSFQEAMSEASLEHIRGLNETLDRTRQGLNSVPDLIARVVDDLERHADAGGRLYLAIGELIERQAECARQTASAGESIRDTMEKGRALLTDARGIVDAVGGIREDAGRAVKALSSSADLTETAVMMIRESVERIEKHHAAAAAAETKSLEAIRSLVGQSESSVHQATERLDALQEGIREAFRVMQEGMARFGETSVERVNDYLAALSEQLARSAGALHTTLDRIESTFEGLEELDTRIHEYLARPAADRGGGA